MSRRKGSEKTGGRRKGTKNRRTQEVEKAVSSTGITPLEYLLQVMRDPKASDLRRDDAARAAAPYCHARRVPETAEGKSNETIVLSINADPFARPLE